MPIKKIKKSKNNLPMILVILDGWGIAKPSKGNAISLASTPVINDLYKKYPSTLLSAHGKYAGLPPNQVGNSEAGHMNIGAGRLVEQDSVRISKSINDGSFFKNIAFIEAVRHVKINNSKLHLMGLLSSGSSPHSDPDHILALLILARNNGIKNVCLHLFTDGRDSPKYSALKMVNTIEKSCKNGEKIATIIGRFYAMDRKKKWDRTELVYDALTLGNCKKAASPQAAITESYNKGDSDEFIEPYVINNQSYSYKNTRIDDGDSVIFFNLRSDRSRQLVKTFGQNNFNRKNADSFKRKKVLKNTRFIVMTDFGPDLDNIITAFPSIDLLDTLPMQLSGLKQLYIAEAEKYAHVTYFFNGGYADPVAGEARIVIPSPNVKAYDETPLMSTKELVKIIIKNVKANKFDFTLLNIAAPDMIGHTGNLKAAKECCEGVDKCLGDIVKSYLKENGTIIVTADHGNIEQMINLKTNEIDTEHSTNQVPFIIASKDAKRIKLRNNGILGDIAPTILDLMGKKKPKEMTGKSLIKK